LSNVGQKLNNLEAVYHLLPDNKSHISLIINYPASRNMRTKVAVFVSSVSREIYYSLMNGVRHFLYWGKLEYSHNEASVYFISHMPPADLYPKEANTCSSFLCRHLTFHVPSFLVNLRPPLPEELWGIC
jgi:hypothetical protein